MRTWRLAAVVLLAGCSSPDGGLDEGDRVRFAPPSPTSDGPLPFPEPAALASLFGPDYDRALAAVGLTRADARCTPQDLALAGQGRFRTALYDAIQSDPTLVDRYSRTFREMAFASARTPEAAAMFAAARLGAGVRITLLGDPLRDEVSRAEEPGALEAAAKALGAETVPDAAGVPPRVAAAAALVLRAVRHAGRWTFRAGVDLPVDLRPNGFRLPDSASDASLLLVADEENVSHRVAFEEAAARADLRYLARATAEVALAADLAARWLAEAPAATPFEWRCGTPEGEVLIRGGGDDADGDAERGEFLLRMDTGGDDRYTRGAATSRDCPFSVLLDAAGDDRYESPPDEPGFGAGFRGVAILIDLAGNDQYALRGTKSVGLGAGVFGAGILFDAAGDDTYRGGDLCMGAAVAGFGVLADLGGRDRYEAFSYAQGFGFVLGSGLLVDLSGDDEYFLNDTEIRRPSPQSKEHNSSLGQGFGYGLRADYRDGHSLAGGVGILADREGNDSYSCGVMGQGGGYWMGVGMLLEGGGDDRYDGTWYAQGTAAHFAVGVLDDAAGNDRYTATRATSQGVGHDYSVGALLDRGGNDEYAAPDLSTGAGNSNGIGFLVDSGGDDRYRVAGGRSLGPACVEAPPEIPTLRHGSLTLGVFLDLGGADSYADAAGKPLPLVGEGLLWRYHERLGAAPHSNARGVGLDR